MLNHGKYTIHARFVKRDVERSPLGFLPRGEPRWRPEWSRTLQQWKPTSRSTSGLCSHPPFLDGLNDGMTCVLIFHLGFWLIWNTDGMMFGIFHHGFYEIWFTRHIPWKNGDLVWDDIRWNHWRLFRIQYKGFCRALSTRNFRLNYDFGMRR